jgi:serine/threonine-protein kinase
MKQELRPGQMLGNYELLLRIGRGGMATVWVARERAEDPRNDRLVAIKALLSNLANESEFVRMFLDEVRLVRAIHHPNVVDMYDVGEQDGTMYMAMEWVEGEPLHTVISEAGKRRPIPPEMAVRIIADAAAGLHAAHELRDERGRLRGLVHRDVSPHNILMGTNGAIKLVDFGVAKALGRISDATRSGQLKGKFGYMSPEQVRGKHVDRRSDVFSLGIVLFELTTNRRLFRGNNDVDTLRLVLSGRVPRPSSIESGYPRRLEQIVLRALEREPDARYQTADEFRLDLEAYLKAERIVIPRSGLAGLLKRVMGQRIEQRRKALLRMVRALDGAKASPALISNDSAFAYGSPESIEDIVSGGLTPSYSDTDIEMPSAPSDMSFSPGSLSPTGSGSETSDNERIWASSASRVFSDNRLFYIASAIIAVLLLVVIALLVARGS